MTKCIIMTDGDILDLNFPSQDININQVIEGLVEKCDKLTQFIKEFYSMEGDILDFVDKQLEAEELLKQYGE